MFVPCSSEPIGIWGLCRCSLTMKTQPRLYGAFVIYEVCMDDMNTLENISPCSNIEGILLLRVILMFKAVSFQRYIDAQICVYFVMPKQLLSVKRNGEPHLHFVSLQKTESTVCLFCHLVTVKVHYRKLTGEIMDGISTCEKQLRVDVSNIKMQKNKRQLTRRQRETDVHVRREQSHLI